MLHLEITRSLILKTSLHLLEEALPNPLKILEFEGGGDDLRIASKALPCPFSLLWEAVQKEGLDEEMLAPVTGLEHPRYKLEYWFDNLVLSEIYLAYYGEDPDFLWFQWYKNLEVVDYQWENNYNEFIETASKLVRVIPCPFKRIKRILINLLEGRKSYHHPEGEPCGILKQEISSQKHLEMEGSKPPAISHAL